MTPQITIKSEDGLNSTYTLIKPDNNICIKEASYPEYVMSFGSTCVVYLAETSNGRKRLIKEFLEKHDTTYEHSILNEIINCHSKSGRNYFSQDDFFGKDEKGKNYHVFPAFEGDIIRPYVVSNKDEFIAVLHEYKSFLCHLEDVHKSFLHWDIKASNVFRFASHDDSLGEYIWELIDFDVSCKIDDTSVYGHGTCRPTSPEWYTDKDLIAYNKLNPNQLADCRFVLDITAAAKLLSYSICGQTQYRRTEFIPSQEGYCTALARVFRKAFHRDLTQRYKSATELKNDIQAIIEASEERQSSAMAWNIREMNTSQLKKIYHQVDSLYEVKNYKINARILTDIKCYELEPNLFSFDEEKGSALEQLYVRTDKNIWLLGEAGSGKSTALREFYLSNFQRHFSDTIVVYKRLSECDKFGEDYSTIELNKIVDISKIDNLPSSVVILLDGYDEIKKRRSLKSQNEQRNFDVAFIKAIENAPTNFRFIITCRYKPEVIQQNKMFVCVTNQMLDDDNIYGYLQIDNNSIKEISENQALLELLRNPFCLTIFPNVIEINGKISYNITTESELIETYLRAMYKSKVGDGYSPDDFEYAINKISTITFNNQCIEESGYRAIRSFIQTFNNYIDIQPIEQDKYKFFFAHELIREYFTAKGLKNNFLEAKQLHERFNLLDSRYSYNVLLLFSQMILSSPFENENTRNKRLLSEIASEYQSIIDERDRKKQKRLNKKWRELKAQGLQQIIILLRLSTEFVDSLEDNGHFPSNLLRIIAFAYGGDLSLFDFGDIRSIPELTFKNCNIIKQIKLPYSLKYIGSWAFQNTGLTNIYIPPNVEQVSVNAFSYCSLENITVDSRNEKYKSIGNCLIETQEKKLILGCKSSKIPLNGDVKYIGEYSFGDCGLEKMTIPHGVVEIESFAFGRCASLKSITLPDTLETINYGAFSYCSKLERIHIPTNVSFIAEGAFTGCLSLTEITVDVNNINYQSINNCLIHTSTKALLLMCVNATIPNDGSVASIAEFAFKDCEALEKIEIPHSILYIGVRAFSGCKKLKSIELSRGMNTIEYNLFWGCEQLSDIIIPDTIERIEDCAFYHCENLSEISLSEGLKYIGDSVFHTCSKLRFLDIPKGVTSIGARVFQYCNSLKTVTIPITVKSIGDSIFYDCFKLTSVRYGGTKKDWENIIKIAPEEHRKWSIGNDHRWSGLNHKFPIKIQCLDGIIEY